MPKQTVSAAAGALFKLLEPFDSADRRKLIDATMTLLGDALGIPAKDGKEQETVRTGPRGGAAASDARNFFDEKQPANKVEELAAAARHREHNTSETSHKKADLEAVIVSARRNFDSHNFRRDIGNATTTGFFNKGGSAKSGYVLSYYGQNYIDALPARDVARKISRPKKRKGVKRSGKKAR